MTRTEQPIRASDWRVAAWRAFLRAHASVLRKLERDLVNEAGMPLGWYDVLVQLAEAPERRLRMADLADKVLLSRSGLTRLVDRLQSEGLVTREPYPGDARGLYTVLTQAGFEKLRAAAPTHLAGVHAYWLSRFSDRELHDLHMLLGRLDPELLERPARDDDEDDDFDLVLDDDKGID
ncbi:MAG TPA: MarR family transcriptional regulator [Jatrophihabitantaceae bacterium]|jgi:DNA-binding MarR family transcriptional regulator